MHQMGYGWYPMHDEYRGRILQHIATIRPTLGIIMTEDAEPIREAYAAHKHSIVARVWAIDDHNGDAGNALSINPERAAADLMDRYCRKRDEWTTRPGMPPTFELLGHAWNEPNQWASYEQIADGTKALLRRSIIESFPMCVLNLGVGHPSGLRPDGSVDWSAFDDEELEDLIEASGSIVGLHGYWQVEGPMHQWTDGDGRVRRDYPFLAGRHHSFPLDCAIAITECGVDGGIYKRNPGWGWQAYRLDKQAFTNQLLANHQALDDRVLAMCPFGLDYQNKEWASFNYFDCLSRIEEWVARADADIPTPPVTVHVPNVVSGNRDAQIRAQLAVIRQAADRIEELCQSTG